MRAPPEAWGACWQLALGAAGWRAIERRPPPGVALTLVHVAPRARPAPPTSPCHASSCRQAVLNVELDLSEVLPHHWQSGMVWAGFTASTGRLHESHAISEWTFHEVAHDTAATVPRA